MPPPPHPHLPTWPPTVRKVGAPLAVIIGLSVIVGLLMISKIPTYSFKRLVISRERARFYLLAVMVLISALLTYMWATLLVLSAAYIATVAWALVRRRRFDTL